MNGRLKGTLVSAVVLYLAFYVIRMERPKALGTCEKLKHYGYSQANNPDALGTAPVPQYVRDILFFWVVRLVLGGLGCLMVYSSYNKIGSGLVLMLVFGGYFMGLYITEQLKHASDDYECHTKPNGFSGHAFYSVWAVLMAWYLSDLLFDELDMVADIKERLKAESWKSNVKVQRRGQSVYARRMGSTRLDSDMEGEDISEIKRGKDEPVWTPLNADAAHLSRRLSNTERWTRLAFKITAVGTVSLCVGLQLFFTHVYGYHSIQQIVFGGCVGLVWAGLSMGLCDIVTYAKQQCTVVYCSTKED